MTNNLKPPKKTFSGREGGSYNMLQTVTAPPPLRPKWVAKHSKAFLKCPFHTVFQNFKFSVLQSCFFETWVISNLVIFCKLFISSENQI